MTPTSLLRTALVLLVLSTVVLLSGCRKLSFFEQQQPSTSRPAHGSSTVSPTAATSAREAETAVRDYLAALDRHDFTVAYELLSRDSQSAHTPADFAQQGKQGMPSFDLKSAKATLDGASAVVEVSQLDDPATHGFHLVREDGEWRVVYRGGTPGMPYAE